MSNVEESNKSKPIIIPIDIGYHNVKAYYEGQAIIFSSKFKTGLENSRYDVLTSDGEEYTIGKGSFDMANDKTKRDNKMFILPAIAKLIPPRKEEISVNLVLALPMADHLKSEDLKKEFIDRQFNYQLNGEEYKIKINDVLVGAEGFSAKYALPEEILALEAYSIVDIGGGTTNVLTIYNGEIETSDTIPLGVREGIYVDIYSVAKGAVRGLNFIEDIDRSLKLGSLDIFEDKIEKLKKDFVIKLSKQLEKFPLAKTIIFVGGGSSFIAEKDKNIFKIPGGFEGDLHILDNAIFANVVGLYKLGVSKWGE